MMVDEEEKVIVLEIAHLVARRALIPDLVVPLSVIDHPLPSDLPQILGHPQTERDHEVDPLTISDVAPELHRLEALIEGVIGEVIEDLLAMVGVHDRRPQEDFLLVEKMEEVRQGSRDGHPPPPLWHHDGLPFRVVEVLA